MTEENENNKICFESVCVYIGAAVASSVLAIVWAILLDGLTSWMFDYAVQDGNPRVGRGHHPISASLSSGAVFLACLWTPAAALMQDHSFSKAAAYGWATGWIPIALTFSVTKLYLVGLTIVGMVAL
jgi:hypothetical protein